ncbi:ATP-binding protein [Streptomyces sp. NPDC127084]|uniref:ATP-binding protein n=1 Tax=Streptomyces sp. NPDC127084 TaxID=3347133 RepID=UPI00366A0B3D
MDPIHQRPHQHGRDDDSADHVDNDGVDNTGTDDVGTRGADGAHADDLAHPADGAHEDDRAHPADQAREDDRAHPADQAHGSAGDRRPAPAQRPPRDAISPELAQKAPAPVRTITLVTGDLLLTVNPIDGSEIEALPPGSVPSPGAGLHSAARRSASAREELRIAARPPVPAGPAVPTVPLFERGEVRERLVRLLSRGRSVRLTGPAGSGRTTLVDVVAEDCENLAPDGVVRLSGQGRTAIELLHELSAAVHEPPPHRPDRTRLLELVREAAAVVVIDDLELGGSALDELLDATPECAYLLAVTPDVPAPSVESAIEEVFLPGLGRSTALQLLEHIAERPLTDDEANWAGDLWFESEGRPLRFVQAGALLRQRDARRVTDPAPLDNGTDDDADEESVFTDTHPTPLPGLGDAAAPAPLLASRLSESARETLRFAVALGGEVPHQAHLPALVGDTHADAAVGELTRCGLLTPVGPRYRLASGVPAQLEAAGYGEGALDRARTAARHYAWWAAHPSVLPGRVVAEAEAVLAATTLLVQSGEPADASAAVLAARSVAPAYAAGLHWGAWERALRAGQEAARVSGEVAQEAYFHHELGVLALCSGNADRARAALEASIALRGALADKSGTVVGRRALALVADRFRGTADTPGEGIPDIRPDESGSPTPKPGKIRLPGQSAETLVTHLDRSAPGGSGGRRRTILSGARRNAVAAGAGVLLVVALGTAVALSTGSDGDRPAQRVTNEQPATEDDTVEGLIGDQPTDGATPSPGGTDDASQSAAPEPSQQARPGESASPSRSSTPDREPSASGGGTGSDGGASSSGGGNTSGGGSSTTGGGGTPSPSTTGGGSPSPSGGTSGSPSPTTTGGSGSPSPSTAGTTSGSQTSGATTAGGATSGTTSAGVDAGGAGSDDVAGTGSEGTSAA